MTVVRMGRTSSNEPPMEFEFPDFMTGCMFMGMIRDHYREDDLIMDMPEEGVAMVGLCAEEGVADEQL